MLREFSQAFKKNDYFQLGLRNAMQGGRSDEFLADKIFKW